MMSVVIAEKKTSCYHCGEYCPDDTIKSDDKYFCCRGCKFVFELLSSKNLDSYYSIEQSPSKRSTLTSKNKYVYLDLPEIREQLIDFSNNNISRLNFEIPQIHCSSCIWLLENLNHLNGSIIDSKVNFIKKEISIRFDESEISLRQLTELLSAIGYEPNISLKNLDNVSLNEVKPNYTIKLAVAGFCFANIMLFSFPEYLATDGVVGSEFKKFFGYLNILLSLPVFFYSASDYLKSGYQSLKQKIINIDVPISLGIIILFGRSLFDIISQSGSGYMDSMSGLVFFLLIGKYFQQKTYQSLSFDRDYKSYFPISVTKLTTKGEEFISVTDIKEGDVIIIRNNELIPADSVLLRGSANIDYSFVSGENEPVKVESGEKIYAGGRQMGTAIELEITKTVSRSYLTRLWNDQTFENESRFQPLINNVSKYFTFGILLVSLLTAIYWYFVESSVVINAVTSVLIIACPCALALSIPFAFGSAQRILGRNKLYLRDSLLLESLSKITDIIFDKTGTLTKNNFSKIDYDGRPLTNHEQSMVKSLVRNSTHPLSINIFSSIETDIFFDVESFEEVAGKGISAVIEGKNIKIGSSVWVNEDSHRKDQTKEKSSVFISIDNEIVGSYNFEKKYRTKLLETAELLSKNYNLTVLSGDNDNERENLEKIFKDKARLIFNQSPIDKLEFVRAQQKDNKKVLMLGDGLNDAGALRQSDIGIAVTDDINAFTPASDAIFDGQNFWKIVKFLTFSRKTVSIVLVSFTISILYNVIGLYFAVQGLLSPLTAAILMPLSSISVVLFTILSVNRAAKKIGI